MNIFLFLFWIIYNGIIWRSNGQSYTEMDSLMKHLFNETRYNKLLRPLHDQNHTMEANFTQYLTSIDTFDISTGELEFSEFFRITWTDNLLTWDPSLYNGKVRLPLPNGQFWKPEIVLRSGLAESPALSDSNFSSAWVNYQGYVVMTPVCSFKVRCTIDTTLYPFDKHECSFIFIVSNHDSTELSLNSQTKVLDTRYLDENGEWKVENIAESVLLGTNEDFDELFITMIRTSFTLKRRPLSAFIYFFVPSQILCILNLFTCCVRPDSGERLTFAVTLYLAFVFTTASIEENIPKNSLRMPVISYFILTTNVINAISVIWSIFVVHLARKTPIRRKLPTFLTKMVMNNKQASTSEGNNEVKPFNESEQSNNEHIQDISDEQKSEKRKVRAMKNDCLNTISGLELSCVLDKIHFWILTFILLFLSIVFFILLLS